MTNARSKVYYKREEHANRSPEVVPSLNESCLDLHPRCHLSIYPPVYLSTDRVYANPRVNPTITLASMSNEYTCKYSLADKNSPSSRKTKHNYIGYVI